VSVYHKKTKTKDEKNSYINIELEFWESQTNKIDNSISLLGINKEVGVTILLSESLSLQAQFSKWVDFIKLDILSPSNLVLR